MFGVGNNNNKAQQMKEQGIEYGGRYPAQTFIDSQVAEVLDKQSGISKGKQQEISNVGTIWGSKNDETRIGGYDDLAGCSKILHKCDYDKEDYDLYLL